MNNHQIFEIQEQKKVEKVSSKTKKKNTGNKRNHMAFTKVHIGKCDINLK